MRLSTESWESVVTAIVWRLDFPRLAGGASPSLVALRLRDYLLSMAELYTTVRKRKGGSARMARIAGIFAITKSSVAPRI